MSAAPTNPTGTVPTGGPPGELAGGVLGLPSVLFCIVTGAAPLAAMLFNVPVATLGGGYASPAAFLVATIALTIFSVGYIAMARRVTSAGGFYTFVTRGLGRVAGLGAGYLIALCYIIFSAAVLGVTSYFASTTVAAFTGIDLPAWVYMIIGLALVSLFAWFHIELTAKVLGVLLVGEVLVLVVMAVGDLRLGGAEGLSRRAAEPGEHLRQLGRGRGVRRRRRGHRAVRRVLVVGRVRDGARTTPRSRATRTRSPRPRRTAR